MKIVWRNPNPINRTSFSIVKTLAVEQPDELRVFYRSSRGAGALGTKFELLVNPKAVSQEAVAIKMQRQSVIREDRLLRAHGSRRGELPGSGVTSSTPHRAGPSAQDPAGTILPTRPLPTGTE